MIIIKNKEEFKKFYNEFCDNAPILYDDEIQNYVYNNFYDYIKDKQKDMDECDLCKIIIKYNDSNKCIFEDECSFELKK
jgi:hypothetical protein